MTAVEDIVRLMKEAGIARGKVDRLTADQSLAEQGLDSYDRMSMLTEIEDHFDIEIPNEVASRLKTLHEIVNYLNSSGGNPSLSQD